MTLSREDVDRRIYDSGNRRPMELRVMDGDLLALISERDELRAKLAEVTTALAAAQAREVTLRELFKVINKGCDDSDDDPYVRGEYTVRDLCREALAQPSDTGALREFGLKVVEAVRADPKFYKGDDGGVVDAVLPDPWWRER